jgi:AraC-like DNA-binding protein
MFYASHIPGPPLGEFVDRLWLCADGCADRKERILPSGTMELVIDLRDNEIQIYDPMGDNCRRFSSAVVSGPYSRGFVINGAQHALIMGVHFKPGGAFPFLAVPAFELTDAHLDLATLWGPTADELRERLCEAMTHQERFRILSEALIVRLHHSPKRHAAVPIALDAFDELSGIPSVNAVARRVGLSHRRFIQVFSAEVGLTPKLYCRVQRFQLARALAQQAKTPDWAKLAVACGYFDQSHLIRDFQEFSGASPTEHSRQQTDDLLANHIAMLE